MPIEPPSTRWVFPDPDDFDGYEHYDSDLVALGADLEPGTVLSAYRQGIFPMPIRRTAPMGWWSPVERGVLPLDRLRVSRSLRQSAKRFTITTDRAYDEVVAGCASRSRPGRWINREIVAAYRRLHDLGWVHSVEVWRGEKLVGGLYGVAVGGLFAGESMFHIERDASKVALKALVDLLADGSPDRLLDVQWATPHLTSLGAVEVSRQEYLRRLRRALGVGLPREWA
jgi:leucyl/phenylalanyl-tRNA--protein transferase